jgi:hypothetical protein
VPTPVPRPIPTLIPSEEPEPTAEITPEPAPDPAEDPGSMDARRAEGQARFESALAAIEPEVGIVRRKLRIYERGCPTATDLVQPRGCGVLAVEIRQLLDDIDRSVEAAEEDARRSWLQPGTLRGILRDRQLDDASRRRMRQEIESSLR